MKTVRNKYNVLIGGDAALSTGTTLNAGEIGVFDALTGARVTAANDSTVTSVMFAQGRTDGGVYAPIVTGPIKLSSVTDANVTNYSAAQEQIDYVGYTGSSSTGIDLINNNSYYMRIYIEELITAHSDGRDYIQGNHKSGTTALGSRIANGLAKTAQNSMAKRAEKLMKFETLCSVAAAALGSGDGTDATDVDVTNGSKAVVINTGDLGTEAVAGDWVRFASGATAVTDPVYRIASVEDATALIILDRPYEGATATALHMDFINDGTGAGESDVSGALWGVKITGVPLGFSAGLVGKKRYMKSRFTTQIDDNGGATAVTASQSALRGTGTWQQVAEYEWFAQGQYKELHRMGEPFLFQQNQDVSSAVTGGGYQILSFNYVEDSVPSFVPNHSPQTLQVCVPDTTSGAGYITDGTNGLNVILPVMGFVTFG